MGEFDLAVDFRRERLLIAGGVSFEAVALSDLEGTVYSEHGAIDITVAYDQVRDGYWAVDNNNNSGIYFVDPDAPVPAQWSELTESQIGHIAMLDSLVLLQRWHHTVVYDPESGQNAEISRTR